MGNIIRAIMCIIISRKIPVNYFILHLVLISPSGRSVDQMLPLATIDAYPTEGFVFFVEQGMSGKLCAANFQTDIPNEKMSVALQTIATSLCRTLNYQ